METPYIYVTAQSESFGLVKGNRYAARPCLDAGSEHLFWVLVSNHFESLIAKNHFEGYGIVCPANAPCLNYF